MTSLDQWDKEIAPKLQEIELSSGWISFYVRKIEQAVDELVAKAPFDTSAEEQLAKARDALSHAEKRLTRAQSDYVAKERVG